MTYQPVPIPLNNIDVDEQWNSRNPYDLGGASSETDEESAGLDGLVTSLRAKGQVTPVDVRTTHPGFYRPTALPYSLVTGFLRIKAIGRIYSEGGEVPGLPHGHILAVDRGAMSERDAFELNALENGNRHSLGPPDTCLQIQRGRVLGLSNSELADLLGKDKKVIERYGKVAELPEEVVRHWRTGGAFRGKEVQKRLSIDKMIDISRKVGKSAQFAAYDRALSIVLAHEGGRRVDGGNSKDKWMDEAMQQAAGLGIFLGILECNGLIHTTNLDLRKHVRMLVAGDLLIVDEKNRKATDKQWDQIGEVAQMAREAVVNPPDVEPER
jgi:hypothetical protein